MYFQVSSRPQLHHPAGHARRPRRRPGRTWAPCAAPGPAAPRVPPSCPAAPAISSAIVQTFLSNTRYLTASSESTVVANVTASMVTKPSSAPALGDVQPLLRAAAHQAGEVGRGREACPDRLAALVEVHDLLDDELRLLDVGVPELLPRGELRRIAGVRPAAHRRIGLAGHRVGERDQVVAAGQGQLDRLEQVEVAVHRARAVVAAHGVLQAADRRVVVARCRRGSDARRPRGAPRSSMPAMERSSKLSRNGAPWLAAIMSTTLSSSGSGVPRCSRTLGFGSRMGVISSMTSSMA